jgi:hypothetical protein
MFVNVKPIRVDVHDLCRTTHLDLANGSTFTLIGKELLLVGQDSVNGTRNDGLNLEFFFRSGDQDVFAGEGEGCAADRGRTKLSRFLSGSIYSF